MNIPYVCLRSRQHAKNAPLQFRRTSVVSLGTLVNSHRNHTLLGVWTVKKERGTSLSKADSTSSTALPPVSAPKLQEESLKDFDLNPKLEKFLASLLPEDSQPSSTRYSRVFTPVSPKTSAREHKANRVLTLSIKREKRAEPSVSRYSHVSKLKPRRTSTSKDSSKPEKHAEPSIARYSGVSKLKPRRTSTSKNSSKPEKPAQPSITRYSRASKSEHQQTSTSKNSSNPVEASQPSIIHNSRVSKSEHQQTSTSKDSPKPVEKYQPPFNACGWTPSRTHPYIRFARFQHLRIAQLKAQPDSKDSSKPVENSQLSITPFQRPLPSAIKHDRLITCCGIPESQSRPSSTSEDSKVENIKVLKRMLHKEEAPLEDLWTQCEKTVRSGTTMSIRQKAVLGDLLLKIVASPSSNPIRATLQYRTASKNDLAIPSNMTNNTIKSEVYLGVASKCDLVVQSNKTVADDNTIGSTSHLKVAPRTDQNMLSSNKIADENTIEGTITKGIAEKNGLASDLTVADHKITRKTPKIEADSKNVPAITSKKPVANENNVERTIKKGVVKNGHASDLNVADHTIIRRTPKIGAASKNDLAITSNKPVADDNAIEGTITKVVAADDNTIERILKKGVALNNGPAEFSDKAVADHSTSEKTTKQWNAVKDGFSEPASKAVSDHHIEKMAKKGVASKNRLTNPITKTVADQNDTGKSSKVMSIISKLGRATELSNAGHALRVWKKFHSMPNLKDMKQSDREQIFSLLLSTFFSLRRPERAVEVWNFMVASGFPPQQKHWQAMMVGTAKAKDVASLHQIWSNMKAAGFEPDNHSWTSWIHGLIKCGDWRLGINALEELALLWKKPPGKTKSGSGEICQLLPAIEPVNGAISGLLATGKTEIIPIVLRWAKLHKLPISTSTFNMMLRPAVRKDDTQEVYRILSDMELHNCQPDIVTLTTILDGFVSNANSSFHAQTLESQHDIISALLATMQEKGLHADTHTYSTLLNGLLAPQSLNLTAAHAVLDHMAKNRLKPSPHIYTILMMQHFAAKPPNLAAVDSLWHRIRLERGTLDSVFYDRVIEGYARNGGVEKMLYFVRQASREGKTLSWMTLLEVLRQLAQAQKWSLATEFVDDVLDRRSGILRHGEGFGAGKEWFWDLVGELKMSGYLGKDPGSAQDPPPPSAG